MRTSIRPLGEYRCRRFSTKSRHSDRRSMATTSHPRSARKTASRPWPHPRSTMRVGACCAIHRAAAEGFHSLKGPSASDGSASTSFQRLAAQVRASSGAPLTKAISLPGGGNSAILRGASSHGIHTLPNCSLGPAFHKILSLSLGFIRNSNRNLSVPWGRLAQNWLVHSPSEP